MGGWLFDPREHVLDAAVSDGADAHDPASVTHRRTQVRIDDDELRRIASAQLDAGFLASTNRHGSTRAAPTPSRCRDGCLAGESLGLPHGCRAQSPDILRCRGQPSASHGGTEAFLRSTFSNDCVKPGSQRRVGLCLRRVVGRIVREPPRQKVILRWWLGSHPNRYPPMCRRIAGLLIRWMKVVGIVSRTLGLNSSGRFQSRLSSSLFPWILLDKQLQSRL